MIHFALEMKTKYYSNFDIFLLFDYPNKDCLNLYRPKFNGCLWIQTLLAYGHFHHGRQHTRKFELNFLKATYSV